jgi:hypothetical protein
MGKRVVKDDQLAPRQWLVAREDPQREPSGKLIKTAAKKRKIAKSIEATKMLERKKLSGNKSIPMGSDLLGIIGRVWPGASGDVFLSYSIHPPLAAKHPHVTRNKFHF